MTNTASRKVFWAIFCLLLVSLLGGIALVVRHQLIRFVKQTPVLRATLLFEVEYGKTARLRFNPPRALIYQLYLAIPQGSEISVSHLDGSLTVIGESNTATVLRCQSAVTNASLLLSDKGLKAMPMYCYLGDKRADLADILKADQPYLLEFDLHSPITNHSTIWLESVQTADGVR